MLHLTNWNKFHPCVKNTPLRTWISWQKFAHANDNIDIRGDRFLQPTDRPIDWFPFYFFISNFERENWHSLLLLFIGIPSPRQFAERVTLLWLISTGSGCQGIQLERKSMKLILNQWNGNGEIRGAPVLSVILSLNFSEFYCACMHVYTITLFRTN